MSEQQFSGWEREVWAAAQALPYPPTPDVAKGVRRRLEAARTRPWAVPRLAWVIALIVLAFIGLAAVPQVRAAIWEIVRIGVVQIFIGPATPTLPPAPSPTGGATGLQSPPTATIRPSPTPLPSFLDLAGESTLREARASSGLEIPLPGYPPDLGSPDRVYLQDQGGPVVVLVWLEPEHPDRIRLSLHLLASEAWGIGKLNPPVLQMTAVNGLEAVWT